MKRKAIISLIIVLSMVFMLTVPAMAQEAVAPQDELNEDDRSPGAARVTGEPGDWEITKDDSNVIGPIVQDVEDFATADIAVWAKIVDLGDAGTIIYCIDIEWGNMKFVFGKDGGVWDPETRTYGTVDAGSWWEDNYREEAGGATEFYLDGINNRVTVTNRSNEAVEAAFEYAFCADFAGNATAGNDGDNMFNKDSVEANRVVGNFFNVGMTENTDNIIAQVREANQALDDEQLKPLVANAIDEVRQTALTASNNGAIAASEILTDAPSTVQAQVAGLPEFLAHGDTLGIISAANPDNAGFDNAFPFIDVVFAFSGTPDGDSDLLDAPFTKVGIITVTITPNP